MEKASVKRIFWTDIRSKLIKVNPSLVQIIDDINPDKKFPLYVARYPYGSTIVEEGVFKIPTPEGELVSIDNFRIDSKIKDELTYSGVGVPAGIVLENTAHEAVTSSHQTLPLGVVHPGSIFALWKKLDSKPSFHPINMFTITAGARFIFMVPNISNLTFHKNLKRDFNFKLPPPQHLLDQWEIFKAITHSSEMACRWATELLFFSKQWFERIKNDDAWKSLYLLMLETVWKKSAYERNIMFYYLAFSRAQANRNLKPNPYLADTAKHLFMVAAGAVPGLSPATDDNCAPISFLQKAYVESYGLEYVPTILKPTHFSLEQKSKPVYYSMALPTTLEFSPKSRKVSSTVNDLSELKHVINSFLHEIKKNKLKVENTVLDRIASQVEFDFFHNKLDCHGEIYSTHKMVKDDPSLLYYPYKLKIKKFADSGGPVRGCIRIAIKK